MNKKYLLITILTCTTMSIASEADINSQNLKYMYEGAKEIEMLNRSMEAGMREHNQKVQPTLTQTSEKIIDNTPIENFQDRKNDYYLEKNIPDAKNTKVKVTVVGDMIKIVTTTDIKKKVTTENGMGESSFSSSTTEELPIPFNSNIHKMTKEYKNGILKISIPKK
ncbi:MAG TPA: Hsp20/alpha crystallin family protein [Campylobacterales bacterium]|nr:Hsp20/alpha crystallin family protein [Campylobacterales bacterium]